MGYVLIVGAKSDMAKAVAREYAKNGYDIYLAARDTEMLKPLAKDIAIRTECNVQLLALDILDFESHQNWYAEIEEKPAGVVCAVGYLGEQTAAQEDFPEAKKIIDTNYTGIVSLFNVIANDFERRKEGFIVGISSVAGERGRKSNYIYGSAKAAFTAYLSGLRNRLYASGVQVLTVKPGFVATRMTAHMDLPKHLTAAPEEVAKDIFRAQQKGKDILYTKWMWRWVMLVIRSIPEFQFKKMSI